MHARCGVSVSNQKLWVVGKKQHTTAQFDYKYLDKKLRSSEKSVCPFFLLSTSCQSSFKEDLFRVQDASVVLLMVEYCQRVDYLFCLNDWIWRCFMYMPTKWIKERILSHHIPHTFHLSTLNWQSSLFKKIYLVTFFHSLVWFTFFLFFFFSV